MRRSRGGTEKGARKPSYPVTPQSLGAGTRHSAQRRAQRFYARLGKDLRLTTAADNQHVLFAAVREAQCQSLRVTEGGRSGREETRTLGIFRRRRLKPRKGSVFDEERAVWARRLVEEAVSARLRRYFEHTRWELSKDRDQYVQRERRARKEITHESNECVVRVQLENEERALRNEVAKLKKEREVARFQAAHGLFKLDVQLQEIGEAQKKVTKELDEYSKQVEVENTNELEIQRMHIEELEKEMQLVIEEEATTRALLVAIQKKVQHQQASRDRKRDMTNEKELPGWKAKIVSQLKSAKIAVSATQSIQERLKRSVSCIMCSKWTMDPVVLVPCGHLYCAECCTAQRRTMKDGQKVIMCAFGDCAAKGIPSTTQIENLDICRICRLFVTKRGTESTVSSLAETIKDNMENVQKLPTSRLLYRNRFYNRMALNIRDRRGGKQAQSFAALFAGGARVPLRDVFNKLSVPERRGEAATLIQRWWKKKQKQK